MSETSAEHEDRAARRGREQPVRCAVLTVSDTRDPDSDESGPLIERLLADRGHEVVARDLVPDQPDLIAARLEPWLRDPRIQAVFTTGGTGISPRDSTTDVVAGMLTMELEGFGELFRMLSYRDIKAAAMLSRAVGGLAARTPGAGGDTFLFALPGSTDAVKTAVGELIAPQLAHLVWLRAR
ncbi:MAG: MogA/MoaB family molybdenum cofactor biosynthesis protein [Planctomycetota bacterium]|jgi:molybdenum cofactor biosynthesis protein B